MLMMIQLLVSFLSLMKSICVSRSSYRNWSEFSVSWGAIEEGIDTTGYLRYFSRRAGPVIKHGWLFFFLRVASKWINRKSHQLTMPKHELCHSVWARLNFTSFLHSHFSGTYGTVYICKEKATGLQLAAKFVKINCKEDRRNMEREIEIMSGLHHPRIIQLYDAYDDGSTIVCVLELYVIRSLINEHKNDSFDLFCLGFKAANYLNA